MMVERLSAAFASPIPLSGKAARLSSRIAPARQVLCVTAAPRTEPEGVSRRRGNGGRGSRAKLPETVRVARLDGASPGKRVAPHQKLQRKRGEGPEDFRERVLNDVKKEREALSASVDPRNRRRIPRHNAIKLTDLQLGTKFTGTVQNLVRHGAYVDIGAVTDGLVHIRDMSVEFVYSSDDVVRTGQKVDVWVKYVNPIKRVVGLTMVPPAKPVSFDERLRVKDLEIGKRYEGTIARVTNYGVYVDLGAERHGFIHVSALWGRRPRETLESLRLGRPIWVHVDEIDEIRSFIRLRARGTHVEEPLGAKGPVGALHKDLISFGDPNGFGAVANFQAPVVDPRIVLQRFGEDLDLSKNEDEQDEDEIAKDDEEDDEDDQAEDEDDEYELDYNDEIISRIHPSNEVASYDLYDVDEDEDDDDDDSDEVDVDARGDSFDQVWSESDVRSRRYVDQLSRMEY